MKDICATEIDALLVEIKNILPEAYTFLTDAGISLLKFSENVTCLVNANNGEKYILRINRPMYHSDEELEGELLWMEEIHRDTNLLLPEVFKGNNGKYIQKYYSECKGMDITFSLFSFLEGCMVGALTGKELIEELGIIGQILAKLHLQWMNRKEAYEITRFHWGYKDLFTAQSRWGDYHNFTGYSEKEMNIIENAANLIEKKVRQFGIHNDTYGMIHADMHRSNIIVNNGRSQVFDFDDCGYGWYLYDIGCCLVEYEDNIELYTAAVISGYESIRKLSQKEIDMIGYFVLLRRIVRLAWISSHSDSDTVKGISDKYHQTTLSMALKLVNA